MGILIDHSKKALLKPEVAARKCLATPLSKVLITQPWLGELCFVIGGGPSLSGFNWSALKGFNVIGTNKSFLFYPADINYSMDYNFFDLVQNAAADPKHPYHQHHLVWKDYKGLKVFLRRSANLRFAKDIYYVEALKDRAISQDVANGIWSGNNTGCGAVMLAVALGATKIGLLGFDFRIEGKQTHFHDGYYYQKPDALQKNLPKFCECLDSLAPLLESAGVEVINLSPSSELKNYPKSSFEDFVAKGNSLYRRLEPPNVDPKVFIIGGGPSVKMVDLRGLSDLNTIVVNCAVFDVPNPKCFVTKDYTFLLKVPKILDKMGGQKSKMKEKWNSIWKVFVACFAHGYLKEVSDVITDVRFGLKYNLLGINEIIRTEKEEGIGRDPGEFCAGLDSGFSALQYAISQGYREIYLLGFDFNTSFGNHYHSWYSSDPAFQKKLESYFECYRRAFSIINTWSDVKVYSCSPISRLNTIIPSVEFSKVISSK